jgi:hypothetical protein
MGTSKGNGKYIETPEKMWEYFEAYRSQVKANPRTKTVFPGKDAIPQHEPLERPLTLEGFENWCADAGIIEDLGTYFTNRDKRYDDYVAICSRIKRVIRQDQIEGGMVGQYNPSITQRINNLVERQENTVHIEQPLFGDGL